uniref:Reticulon n=1 Tax=Melopsittacus undulatus TaxID=13146 RepID=A0A8V5GLJ3_MELUD
EGGGVALLLWRDPRRSALVLGASLAPLLSLAALSAVSVCAHVALALLCVTVSARAARGLLQALHRADEGHPFRTYLEKDITISPESFRAVVAAVTPPLNRALRLLLRLFLVEDLVDSLKLAVCMWMLTYVGAVFNGITLLILGKNQALPPLHPQKDPPCVQIDQYVAIARSHSKDLMAKYVLMGPPQTVPPALYPHGPPHLPTSPLSFPLSHRIQAKVPGLAKKKPE